MKRFMLTACVLAGLAAVARPDGGTEATDVKSKDGNPSPTAADSHVDDYKFQDEQINIDASQNNVVKVLRVNQKNLVNDYQVAVFPIQNAAPIELRNAFRVITASEGGRAEVIRDKKQNKQYLWVAAPRFQIPYIQAAVQALDVPWLNDDIDGSAQAYYRARFRDIAKINELLSVAGSAGLPGEGEDNTVYVDSVNNAALYVGEPYRAGLYAAFAPRVDLPVPQMTLEAAVYEVEVSRETRIGLDYIAWKNGPGRNLFEFVAWKGNNNQTARHMTSVFDPFIPARTAVAGKADLPDPHGDVGGNYYSFNYLLTTAWLDFLVGSGRARLVTRGKIRAKNGELGSLSAVDQEIYFQTSTDERYHKEGSADVPNTPVNGICPTTPISGSNIPVWDRTLTKDGKLSIGFVMTVRGYIAQETTELHITLSLNDIVGTTPSGVPQVRTNDLTTTVLVADGQPICVGGLRRTEDVKHTAKMPILGSIPVLGWLFGHEATSSHETEIVVVLTPRIRLGSEADLEMASEEDKLVRQQVERQARLPLPATQVGFDQWLLDQTR